MNRSLSLIFFLLSFSSSAVIVETSFDRGNYIETFGAKRLTTEWAQEYIGSDLVKEELRDLNLGKVKLAIFDLGFEQDYVTLNRPIEVPPQLNRNRRMTAHHGTSVASVINGPESYGHSEAIDLINLSAISFAGYYSFAFRNFEQNNEYPKIISNSLGWGSDSIKEVAKKASDKNILWFLASGNDWPTPVRDWEIDSEALLVGSFAPNGLTTFGTQLHDDMLILAPSNSELLAINGYGNRTLFGGTSGATPVVAATMANIATLWPEVDRESTKKLLLHTSFASAENKLGNEKAPRLLNSYRAFKIAQRVLSSCSGESNLKTCFLDSLDNPSFYFFDLEVISCAEFVDTHRDFQADILKKMRRRGLLGIKGQDQELACAYRFLGFEKNAEFYEFRSNRKLDMNNYLEETKEALSQGVFEISFYKYFTNMNEKELVEAIESSAEISDYRKRELLSYFAERISN